MKKQIPIDSPQGLKILSACFLWGGLLGIFLAGLINQEGQGSLADFFLTYFNQNQQNQTPDFFYTLWHNCKTPLSLFLLGFSLLGTLGIPFLFLIQGFYLSFSISTLCRLWGVGGIIPAFFLFGLPAFLWVPVYFFLGLQSFRATHLLWHRTKPQEIYHNGYFFQSSLGFLGVLASVGFDFFLMPILIEAVKPFTS